MRMSQQAGFVLHQRQYRESSLIVDILSREQGRLSLVARGARRWQKRRNRPYLRQFQEFLFDWTGRGEMGTLVQAEEHPPIRQLTGQALYCGFYVNELLLRLLHRHDPHEVLYDRYGDCLARLASSDSLERELRLFERDLLLELGYGLLLDHTASGERIEADRQYRYFPLQGPEACTAESARSGDILVSGKSLLAYAGDRLDEPDVLLELKGLMRRVLDHHLGHKPLTSRHMFRPVVKSATRNPDHLP